MATCLNCFATLADGTQSCDKCGATQPTVSAGQDQSGNDRFLTPQVSHYRQICAHCGTPFDQLQAVCSKCFRFVGHPKDKQVALILAVFFGFVTWGYTFERDKARFWAGLAVFIVGMLLSLVIIGYFVILGLWIYAILDTVRQPVIFFENYPAVAHERVA